MQITVFGGSAPKPGDPAYQEAFRLGQRIGEGGHTILTGGYIGTMEAASRGCAEAGGRVIGVTCDQIETWRPVKPNQWVQQEIRCATVKDRLFTLIENCDRAVALPGGAGTLAEIAVMWNQMQVQAIPARPLVLVGAGWQLTFETMYQHFEEYIPGTHRQLLNFARDEAAAYRQITGE